MEPVTLDILGRIFHAVGWVFLPFLVLPILCFGFATSKFLANFQFTLIEIIDNFNFKLGESVKWLLVVFVVSVAFGVIALSIFGQSWTKFDESATYFHALIILLGSGATLLASQHVRVDIFYSKMGTTAKALVDLLGFYMFLIPFCLVIIWNAQGTIALSWLSYEGSAESDGIRGIFLLKTCLTVFALMLILQGMAIAGRAALLLTNRQQPPLPDTITPLFGEPQSDTYFSKTTGHSKAGEKNQ